MPYLYTKAVEAHETGVPMMRAMMAEFAGDPACEDLDRQYMLGDALLVAPVLREDGFVEYYLPTGKWTHLLSGKDETGNTWKKEQYDFFSLPLFVRENTILPIGAHKEGPVYDYTDGVTLRLYNVTHAERMICNSKGEKVLTVKAIREGDTLTVTLDGAYKNAKILLVNTKAEAKDARQTAEGTLIPVTGDKVIAKL